MIQIRISSVSHMIAVHKKIWSSCYSNTLYSETFSRHKLFGNNITDPQST